MRIGFVTPEYVTENRSFDGGLANYLHRLSSALKRLGHEPLIFTLSERSGIITHDGIEVHRVQVRKMGPGYMLRDLLTLRRKKQALKLMYQSGLLRDEVLSAHAEKKIDIVQYASYRSVGFSGIGSIPSVIRISSYQKLWDRAYHGDNIKAGHLAVQRLEEKTLRDAGHIFGPGRDLAKEIEKDLGKRIRIIETPFVLEAGEYDYSRAESIGGDYLLFFGSIGVLKGAGTIAGILELLLEKYPDIRFVFAGKDMGIGGGSAEVHLKEKAGKYRDRIVFTGILRHETLYPLIERSMAVVLPSLIDNFPNACLEAMAHGKTVVGTRGTSFEQLIDDGANGFLCDPGDSADLYAKIEKVLQLQEDQKRAIGEKSRETILRLHPDRTVAELTSYYKEVIDIYQGDEDAGTCRNRFALGRFSEALRLFYAGRFRSARKVMAEYRENIDYGLFEITDNREAASALSAKEGSPPFQKKPAPTVSVLVVAYDTNRLLIECLESLEKQSSGDYEVIVIDNGFNDAVAGRLREMNLLYIRVPQNLFLSEGRNIGAHFARGKIIAFLDDDALVPDDYIETIAEAFSRYNICGFRGRVLEKTESTSNDPLGHYDLGDTPFPSIINTEGNSAFLKEIYERFGGMDPLLFGHEGWDLSYRVSEETGENSFIYWPNTIIYHDYADTQSKLRSKNARHRVMSDYIKKKHPGAAEYRKRMKRFITGDKTIAERLIDRK
ncbi:MAG: glycosyltransferase [Candidatus Krumholzibacteriota bacterium]|nr:glycosyltransferase [Candidatus Krumholzibacteriota bacterium]